jgi:hypothetical protein
MTPTETVEALLPRITKGSDMLLAAEQRGEMDTPQYKRHLSFWLGLVAEYKTACDEVASQPNITTQEALEIS